LNDYGVEETTITENNNQLKIVVKTTRDEVYVDELIKNPYVYKIVTRKDDVDFEDTENQYAMYFGENYEETQFDSTTFRNIFITRLANSSGGKSYFGIAKTWPNKTKLFREFLQANENQYLGVDIDGFVTPVYISDPNIFAIPLTEDSNSLEIVDILYNSGSMPISYEFLEENVLETNQLDINYVEVTIAIFVSIVFIYLYMYITKIYSSDTVLRSLFTTLFSLALLLSYLKITGNETQLSMLIINAVITIFLTNTLQQNKESRNLISLITILVGVLFYTLGIGYLRILGNQLITISIISFISVVIGNFYINKVSKYFKQ
jgi:preprotein translocase subunit SecD